MPDGLKWRVSESDKVELVSELNDNQFYVCPFSKRCLFSTSRIIMKERGFKLDLATLNH
jgi:hypothetical protein